MATSTRNDNNNVRIANGRQDIKPTSVKISVIGTLERSDDRSKRKKQLTLYQISVVVNKTELILNKQYRDFVRLHRIVSLFLCLSSNFASAKCNAQFLVYHLQTS
jgi:hypothetical protein